jgi:hypothetical protein
VPWLFRFCFAGIDSKWQVEWTKTNETCQHKNGCQYKQYDPQSACNNVGKIKNRYNGRNYHPDDPVGGTHVFFHCNLFEGVKKLKKVTT